MEIVPLGPGFAAELRGITLADVAADDAAYAAARAAFEEHSVLVFRGQDVTDDSQLAFSRRFGPPEVTKVGSLGTGSHFVILTTIGPDGKVVPPDHRYALRNKANQLWHTDSSFKSVPALTSILSARIIPARGGETEYVSTRLAFERLDAGPAQEAGKFLRLARLRAFARQDRARPREPRGARGAAAAMLAHGLEKSGQWPRRALSRLARLCGRRHGSGGGQKADRRTDGGRDRAGHELRARSGSSGDVVMWDNRATMHRGRPWPAHEARLMVRTTISATAADGLEIDAPAVAAGGGVKAAWMCDPTNGRILYRK